MGSGGMHCQARLTATAGELQPLGPWLFEEDLFLGSFLRCRIVARDAPALTPGDPLDLRISRPGSNGGDELDARLWITRVERRMDLTSDLLQIEAADPLWHCRGNPQFRTYVGGVSLGVVARRILAAHAAYLASAPRIDADLPDLPQPWLLQAEEDGREFLVRLAAGLGQVCYWDRDRLRCAAGGAAPAGANRIEVDAAAELESTLRLRGVPAVGGRIWWTDPATCETRSFSAGSGGLDQRLVACQAPVLRRLVRSPAVEFGGDRLRAVGSLFRARLGDRVVGAGDGSWCVERTAHELAGNGSCRTTLEAVPPDQWGWSPASERAGMLGPLQAVVTHNHDPERLGRLRVRLVEDPENRPSPFLPLVTPLGGEERGVFWLPEVDDPVLVVADRRCPEALCCLGAVRGAGQRIAAEWSRADNSVKALFARGGVGMLIDDRDQAVRLVAPRAAIAIEPGGDIALTGSNCRQEAGGEFEIKGGRRVGIDAVRIELG